MKQVLLACVLLVARRGAAAAPSVSNDGADALSISAILNGTLLSTGGLPTRVYVCWGKTDGGTNPSEWAQTAYLGVMPEGPVSTTVMYLTPNQTYYYRFSAKNDSADVWATTTASFTTQLSSGPEPVDLLSAARFVILSGAAITSAGGLISGDVGASPIAGSAITGVMAEQVEGTIYTVDATGPAGSVMDPVLLGAAKIDLTAAYNAAAARTPVPVGSFLNPGSGNIGGMTLVPGLYKFTSSALITGGDVTLVGGPNDVWIFQIGSDLQVGSDVQVVLAGDAQARNVFWQVGTSATIGTYSLFVGTIMADQSITMDQGSVLEGRALASEAAVTFSSIYGTLPTPERPVFTAISRDTMDSATVVLRTTPFLEVTLEACPDLLLTNWVPIATETPVSNSWTYTDFTATASITQRFYRAFVMP